MQQIIFPFAGGLGLFLLGMMLLSQGLVAFGGGAMKRALAHFTGTPAKAFLSGTLATMAVQSSTATTVTLIGFVSAGLISFTQAIGVLIGASLGNTATGWIVATLGLKVNLGFYTLPLIGVGAMLKLLTRGGRSVWISERMSVRSTLEISSIGRSVGRAATRPAKSAESASDGAVHVLFGRSFASSKQPRTSGGVRKRPLMKSPPIQTV